MLWQPVCLDPIPLGEESGSFRVFFFVVLDPDVRVMIVLVSPLRPMTTMSAGGEASR